MQSWVGAVDGAVTSQSRVRLTARFRSAEQQHPPSLERSFCTLHSYLSSTTLLASRGAPRPIWLLSCGFSPAEGACRRGQRSPRLVRSGDMRRPSPRVARIPRPRHSRVPLAPARCRHRCQDGYTNASHAHREALTCPAIAGPTQQSIQRGPETAVERCRSCTTPRTDPEHTAPSIETHIRTAQRSTTPVVRDALPFTKRRPCLTSCAPNLGNPLLAISHSGYFSTAVIYRARVAPCVRHSPSFCCSSLRSCATE